MINRNWPFPIGETNRVLSILHYENCTILHYENCKCDWLCLVSSDTWSNILHPGCKGTKRFGIYCCFLKKNRKNFSPIYLLLIYIHVVFAAAICPETPAEPPGRGTQSVKRVQLSVICLFRMHHTRTTFAIEHLVEFTICKIKRGSSTA